MKKSQMVYLPFKRILDIFGSVVGIIICLILLWWWVIPVNTIVTRCHPFFARYRVGKDGKPFRCLKFRSMRNNANPNMSSLDECVSNYVTKFGRFLRSSSIDETPQLFNILFGQMSFIGPRPLIGVNSIDLITINQRKIDGVDKIKPGLSGYAQIHKRGDLDPLDKAAYDKIYLENMSFLLDFKIFCYTLLRSFGAVKGR